MSGKSVKDPLTQLLLLAASRGDDVVIDAMAGADERKPRKDKPGYVDLVPTVEFMAALSTGNEEPVNLVRNQEGEEILLGRRPTGIRGSTDIKVSRAAGADKFHSVLRKAARAGSSVMVVPYISPRTQAPTVQLEVWIGARQEKLAFSRDGDGRMKVLKGAAKGKRGTPDEPVKW